MPLRADDLHATLGRATTRWGAAVALARFWRDHLPQRPARRTSDPDRRASWGDLVGEVEAHFDGSPEVRLSADDHDALRHWLGPEPAPDDVDAVAWGMNLACGAGFATSWREELGSGIVTLAVGQAYPVANPRWPQHAGALLPQPPSSTPPDVDEYPYLRFHRPGRFEIVADLRHWHPLARVLNELTEAATLHPNGVHAEDFVVTITGGTLFPLRLRRPAGQRRRMARLLDAARDRTAAQLVVGTELSLDDDIVADVAEQVRTWPRRALVVAGSHHVVGEHGEHENLAVGFLTGRRYDRLEHRKVTAVDDDLRVGTRHWREGLDIPERPRLVVHHADAHRLAILICKDFLDDHVHDALTRAGVNVVCVVAMSEKTEPFPLRAAQRLASSQCLTVVANGPETWPARRGGAPVLARHGAVAAAPAATGGPPQELPPPATPGLVRIRLWPDT